jgi:hypothetical protein
MPIEFQGAGISRPFSCAMASCLVSQENPFMLTAKICLALPGLVRRAKV